VTTAGSDSGTAATTRLIAATTMSSTGCPRTSPPARTIAHSATVTPASRRPMPIRCRCNGVRPGAAESILAIRPVVLAAPVAVTTARPRPLTSTVPADTETFSASTLAARAAVLSTGSDSPVTADSSTSIDAASTTVASAGTMSPSASTSRSPTTTSLAGI
jgi:hypothetical protein